MSTKHELTRLENFTYNILIALGMKVDFLYSTVDTYIEDAKKDNRQKLVEIWNKMKREKASANVKGSFRKRGKRPKVAAIDSSSQTIFDFIKLNNLY